jgi:cyclohexanone monooxygenase
LSFAFNDMFRSEESNRYAQEYARERIRAVVTDPNVAELLCPQHHIGTKRTCTDTNYFETFNRPNVELIDVKSDPIEAITARGIRTSQREIEVDDIIFAIGFDAISGALTAIDIRGRQQRALRDAWQSGPRAYLGVQVADFPNLFLVTGPGSPSVLSNMVVSIEQHVDWIAAAINHLRSHGFDTMEATSDAEDAWMVHVDDLAGQTLYPRANSWYVGANIPGKRHPFPVYVAGCGPYRHEADAIAAEGYRGFTLSTHSTAARDES